MALWVGTGAELANQFEPFQVSIKGSGSDVG
jgi:hypothetical protein